MASTRFNYDPERTKKNLQQSTDSGRWILNTPGNGDKPYFMEDPHIILQKWGANRMTNQTELESELFVVNRKLNRDSLAKDNIRTKLQTSVPIQYPTTNKLSTEESRSILPVWTARELEQTDWSYPLTNPQENVFLKFESYLDTRVMEKDSFTQKRYNNNLFNI
jgi:hypothetical protein